MFDTTRLHHRACATRRAAVAWSAGGANAPRPMIVSAPTAMPESLIRAAAARTRRRRVRAEIGRSTRLNSSHEWISYAVFCLKKKKSDCCPVTVISTKYTTAPLVSCTGSHFSDTDVFFFNDTATTEIYTLSLHDALPI